jgi:hypothetical protein
MLSCLQKSIIVKDFFINLFDTGILPVPKIKLASRETGRISGIRPLPDIRYPAKTVSGASLQITNRNG